MTCSCSGHALAPYGTQRYIGGLKNSRQVPASHKGPSQLMSPARLEYPIIIVTYYESANRPSTESCLEELRRKRILICEALYDLASGWDTILMLIDHGGDCFCDLVEVSFVQATGRSGRGAKTDT